MTKLRDKFWLWGQSPNTHHSHLQTESRMTAAEGCMYFGIDRCCRVVMCSHPRPPFDQESIAMEPLKEVVWSIVGACGTVEHNDGKGDIDEVLRQANMFDNITGGVLDDFFVSQERRAAFPPEALAKIRTQLKIGARRPLDLWMVVYATNLELPIQPYLDLCDVLTFWTWKSEDLVRAPENFESLIERTPGKRHLNGCYMYDYGNNRPMPLDLMKKQAALYEKWLLEGKSDGLVICSNCCADVGLETVKWTRDWLRDIGRLEIADLNKNTKKTGEKSWKNVTATVQY